LEFAKVTRDFGQTYKEGDDLVKFLNDLVSFVEGPIYLSRKINYVLDRVNDQKIEFIASGNGKDEDGNLRIINSNGNFLFQKRNGDSETGTWDDENEIVTTS
jgi:hypothetical protein